jgi:hypothetical protein
MNSGRRSEDARLDAMLRASDPLPRARLDGSGLDRALEELGSAILGRLSVSVSDGDGGSRRRAGSC